MTYCINSNDITQSLNINDVLYKLLYKSYQTYVQGDDRSIYASLLPGRLLTVVVLLVVDPIGQHLYLQ